MSHLNERSTTFHRRNPVVWAITGFASWTAPVEVAAATDAREDIDELALAVLGALVVRRRLLALAELDPTKVSESRPKVEPYVPSQSSLDLDDLLR